MGNQNSNNCSKFLFYCKNRHLENAKRLYFLGNIADVYKYLSFQFACEHGHLEIAQWLYSIGNYDICDYMRCFRFSCENGHLNVAKWLYSLDNIDFTQNIKLVIHLARQNERLEICQWLDFINMDIGTYIKNKEFTKIITFLNIKKEQHDLSDIGCPICYDKTPDFTVKTNCGHIFCISCINTVKNSNNNCPICRCNIKYFSYDMKNMTEYTYCEDCKVFIPYVQDKDRYLSCSNCRQDLYVGTKKLYKKGKFSKLKNGRN